uniref:Inner nuclear membrane protein Man1 n=1 Tax=Electrophorus electricus TaxID=8005 RepID=A0A4W4GM06_ELEEL
MASTQLTDEQLFSELKRLGFTPGPLTENTRPVYLKKLKKLREEQQQQRSRGAKGRNSGSISNNSGSGGTNGNTAAGASGFRTRAPLNAAPSPGGRRDLNEKRTDRAGKFVLGFSSDESDAEAPLKKGGPSHNGSRRDRGSGPQSRCVRPTQETPAAARRSPGAHLGLSAVRRSAFTSPWWTDQAKSDLGETHSRTVNGNRASYAADASKLAGDYSDSDEEEDREGHGQEKASGIIAVNDPPGVGSLDVMGERGEDDDETSEFSGGLFNRSYPKSSSFISGVMDEKDGETSSSRPAGCSKNHVDGGDGVASRFRIGLRPRFSSCNNSLSTTYRPNHSNHTGSNHSYSQAAHKHKQAVPEDELLQQFRREEVSSTGGFSAHYLSMFLLTAACLFFVVLGLMYLRMRGSSASEGVVGKCCVSEKDLILSLLLQLHDHLADIAGEHDCKDLTDPLNRSISFSEATQYLKLRNKDYENWIQSSLEWIIKTGETAGIRLIAADPTQPVEDVSEIYRLESTHPRMSFLCRFRRAFLIVIYRAILILTGIGVVWGLMCYMKYRWRREEEETRQMYDMVERIIDVLRSHNEACQDNKELQPYLPIPHVRDSLVQPQERKKMKKVWDRAVTFLSANESRIRTETQRIGGADFLVWRWLQPSMSCDKMCSIPSKVWQGKAFPLDRRNSPPNSLTPCLKIRNMFDPVMEIGENWHLAIHEAILEKCSDNDGIVHIAVDKNSREGCVYVKCLSAEHAGKAFKALHGSWFDGKLVTVKYLRLDRYHQRFPQALACSTPLKPSNSSMNTMVRLHQRSSPSSSLAFS